MIELFLLPVFKTMIGSARGSLSSAAALRAGYKSIPSFARGAGLNLAFSNFRALHSQQRSPRTTLRVLKSPFVRSYATVPPHMFPAPRSTWQNIKDKRKYFYGVVLLFAGLYTFWTYKTYHRYPPAVAEKLRLALFAEVKEDYETALKYFLEALHEADKIRGIEASTVAGDDDHVFPRSVGNTLGVPGTPAYESASKFAGEGPPKGLKFYIPANDIYYLSDEYTGLLLKIAEMYENVGLPGDALLVYRELCQSYLYALQSDLVHESQRLDIVRRDLLTAFSIANLNSTMTPNATRLGLFSHLTTAQKELARAHPELKELFDEENLQIFAIPGLSNDPNRPTTAILPARSNSSDQPSPVRRLSVDIVLDPSDTNAAIKARNDAAKLWEPIRDELFTMRQLFSKLCIVDKQIGLAVETTLNTTKWMVAAGFPLDAILTSFYAAGSYLYIQTEEFELSRWKTEYDEKVKNGEIKDDGNSLNLREQMKRDLKSPFFPPPLPGSVARESLDNATTIFTVILQTIKELPGKLRRSEVIAEVQALSTYSLGVIALHDGELDKAEELLREARLRARGCGYELLADHADMELASVADMKKAKETGDDDTFLNGLYNRELPVPYMDIKLVPLPDENEMSLSQLSKS